MSIDERPRGSARPTNERHHNSLPTICLEAALGFAAQHKCQKPAYSPKCVEGEFSEVRIPDPGCRDPETAPNDLTARREAYESTPHRVRPHRYASLCTPDTPERGQVLGSRNQRAVPRFLAPAASMRIVGTVRRGRRGRDGLPTGGVPAVREPLPGGEGGPRRPRRPPP